MKGREHPLVGINRQGHILPAPPPSGEPPPEKPAERQCTYGRAIIEHGGLPLLIPFLDDEEKLAAYVEMSDGIILSGGRDYPPEWYGREPDPSFKTVGPERAACDRILVRLALESGKPVLGICGGLQLANIHLGGGLVMDIRTEVGESVEHRSSEAGDAYHEALIEPGTLAARVLGEGLTRVNSAHHQSADPDRIGRGLVVTARCPADGVIEALEPAEKDGPFRFFVQWHPERILDQEHRRRVFSAFITACREGGAP